MIGLYRVPDARHVFPPVPPEDLNLGTYTFLPHHRTGIAAALTTPFDPSLPARAEVALTVRLVANGGEKANAPVPLTVRGPGDVLRLDGRQVVRRFPQPGTATAEPNDLVHIELDTPDLPWQFTPAGPAAYGLPPWLRLVVAPADSGVLPMTPPAGEGLPPSAEVRPEDLPPAADAWAWAHVQVLGAKASPGLAERLGPASPTLNVARILCPRRLEADTDWVALLVPTFEAGRRAGLGLDVPADATLAYSWSASPAAAVRLPVYDSWTFSTGPEGDFEALARRLLPVPPPEGVGRRLVDTGHPGHGVPRLPNGTEGADRTVYGPLVRVGDPSQDGRSWPPETEQHLTDQLNAPARQRFSDPDAKPTVAAPLYAGRHVLRDTVGEADDPEWFHSLNLDPADRVVAALGTQVVQQDQEDLMVSAWAQVGGVEAANAALRAAQVGRWVGGSAHRRHLAVLPPADLLGVTSRAFGRVLHAPERTVLAEVEDSALPVAAAGSGLRRLARPDGPLARFARDPDGDPAADAARRRSAVRRLLADPEGGTADWVVTAPDPDGVVDVSDAALELLPDSIAGPLREVRRSLGSGGVLGVLEEGGQQGDWAGRLVDADREGVVGTTGSLLERLLGGIPTAEELRADPALVGVALDLVAQVRAVLTFGRAQHVAEWDLGVVVCKRLELDGRPTEDDREHRMTVTTQAVNVGLERVLRVCAELVDTGDPGIDARLLQELSRMRELPHGSLAEDLVRISGDLGVAGVTDVDRSALDLAGLDLVARLDPAVTVTRRVKARLVTRPRWLPSDWFDDTRIDPVMVAPAFHHPMYEALYRFDREWLLPGVAAMPPPEMATLLETNSRFVEAFLIGLNHEFARELVWREYPTDGRATSFRSFWTTGDELMTPVHQLGPGPLGSHLTADLSGAIVLLARGELIRRYPQVLAHAVQQSGTAPPPPVYRDDPDPAFAAEPAETLFRLLLEPDLLLAGFKLKRTDVMGQPASVPPWWFTLSEHVGEPRFGLDVLDPKHPDVHHPNGTTVHRDDLAWGDLAMAGDFLTTGTPHVTIDKVSGHGDAAGWAERLFQLPARAAFLASDMIQKMT